MINLDVQISTPTTLTFLSAPGQTVFADYLVVKDGVITSVAKTITEVSSGVYSMSITFSSTGTYYVMIAASVIACVNVVSKSLYTYLKNLEDEAVGSWVWNKIAKTLTMNRQDGTLLATFNVEETLEQAFRERTA